MPIGVAVMPMCVLNGKAFTFGGQSECDSGRNDKLRINTSLEHPEIADMVLSPHAATANVLAYTWATNSWVTLVRAGGGNPKILPLLFYRPTTPPR